MSTTLSYSHGTGDVSLLGETIGANLCRTVERFPDRDALVVRHQNYRASYRQLWDATTDLAGVLMALGVQKGDRVGIWAPNRFEWVVVQYAAARTGAMLVNINPAYRSAELEYVLNQSGVGLLFLAKEFRSADYVAMLTAVRPRCTKLRQAFVFEADAERRSHTSVVSSLRELDVRGAVIPHAAVSCTHAELDARERMLQCDDAINIQYTSGTTGFPKGATLTHHNILNNAYFVGLQLGYTQNERVCIPVPFYHCFGMVLGNLACTSHGACMVVPSEAYDPLAVLETVQAERCTALYGVPTMFFAELAHPRFAEFDLSSLRTGIMAGSPCPVELMKKVVGNMHMAEVAIGYGMTETSPISTMSAVNDSLERRVTTVGRAMPHVEIKIVSPGGWTSCHAEGGRDTHASVVPRGTPGELCTRGYSVMRGYWSNESATRASIDTAGWMHSGDLATMDVDGYVNIVGRIKDMIIRGGENVSPREIEECLMTHPGVSEAQVIGVPSAKYGEEIMAWVKPRPHALPNADELTQFCTGRLARYKVPRFWKLVDQFPLTVTGKVQKFRMREMAIEELELQDAAQMRTA